MYIVYFQGGVQEECQLLVWNNHANQPPLWTLFCRDWFIQVKIKISRGIQFLYLLVWSTNIWVFFNRHLRTPVLGDHPQKDEPLLFHTSSCSKPTIFTETNAKDLDNRNSKAGKMRIKPTITAVLVFSCWCSKSVHN